MMKIKLNTMNISKLTLGVALFASAITVQAQDINQAKRAIDGSNMKVQNHY